MLYYPTFFVSRLAIVFFLFKLVHVQGCYTAFQANNNAIKDTLRGWRNLRDITSRKQLLFFVFSIFGLMEVWQWFSSIVKPANQLLENHRIRYEKFPNKLFFCIQVKKLGKF